MRVSMCVCVCVRVCVCVIWLVWPLTLSAFVAAVGVVTSACVSADTLPACTRASRPDRTCARLARHSQLSLRTCTDAHTRAGTRSWQTHAQDRCYAVCRHDTAMHCSALALLAAQAGNRRGGCALLPCAYLVVLALNNKACDWLGGACSDCICLVLLRGQQCAEHTERVGALLVCELGWL